MKRALIPVAAVAAAVLVFAVVNAAAGNGHSDDGDSIRVIEHATTDAVTNGTAADSAGNVLTFANDVFNSANTRKVGSDQGYCVRIEVGKSWECIWTTFLRDGQITVEGPFLDAGNSTLAVTGGTGAYRNARGSMELRYRNPAGTEFDFVFRLIG
jgi:allene oxide cyclase